MPELKFIKTKQEFDALLQGNEGVLIIVDFYADWCGPCKRIEGDYKGLCTKYPDVIFAKVNVDENDETSEAEGISAMPTFRAYKNGKKVDEVVGADIAKVEEIAKTKK